VVPSGKTVEGVMPSESSPEGIPMGESLSLRKGKVSPHSGPFGKNS